MDADQVHLFQRFWVSQLVEQVTSVRGHPGQELDCGLLLLVSLSGLRSLSDFFLISCIFFPELSVYIPAFVTAESTRLFWTEKLCK